MKRAYMDEKVNTLKAMCFPQEGLVSPNTLKGALLSIQTIYFSLNSEKELAIRFAQLSDIACAIAEHQITVLTNALHSISGLDPNELQLDN